MGFRRLETKSSQTLWWRKNGFEPSVPLKAPGVFVVSVLVCVEFSVGGESGRDDISRSRKPWSWEVPTVRVTWVSIAVLRSHVLSAKHGKEHRSCRNPPALTATAMES